MYDFPKKLELARLPKLACSVNFRKRKGPYAFDLSTKDR
jgi:hypothetical protein